MSDFDEEAESGSEGTDSEGLDESSIDVTLVDRVLTLSGRLVDEPQAQAGPPAYREQELGSFERHYHLSQDLESEGIEAKIRDGVLELRLPRAEHAQPRRIEVSD